jgi:hypothetical protein
MEVLFDRYGEMYLATGWKKFAHVHEIEAGHFLVFRYDNEAMLAVSVFDETMCRHHYHSDIDSDDE